ncbi:unnamed protein product, partial [Ascophyllum nodosum]
SAGRCSLPQVAQSIYAPTLIGIIPILSNSRYPLPLPLDTFLLFRRRPWCSYRTYLHWENPSYHSNLPAWFGSPVGLRNPEIDSSTMGTSSRSTHSQTTRLYVKGVMLGF